MLGAARDELRARDDDRPRAVEPVERLAQVNQPALDFYLEHGIEHLKPLNLKTVADAISMHESTVSRVVKNGRSYLPDELKRVPR